MVIKWGVCLEVVLTVGCVDGTFCYFRNLWDLALVIL